MNERILNFFFFLFLTFHQTPHQQVPLCVWPPAAATHHQNKPALRRTTHASPAPLDANCCSITPDPCLLFAAWILKLQIVNQLLLGGFIFLKMWLPFVSTSIHCFSSVHVLYTVRNMKIHFECFIFMQD